MVILYLITDIISWIFMIIGLIFCAIGILGFYRMPDLFTKQHALGLIDTMGFICISVSLALQEGFTFTTLKILLLGFLAAYLSSPTTSILVKSAIICKIVPTYPTSIKE